MKKRSKKTLLTALSTMFAVTLTSGLTLTAFADEATKDHVFDAKQDSIFEDFDRADISNTVNGGANVDLGEKPYLHVAYTAGASSTPGTAIYKHGSGALDAGKDSAKVLIRMRAPQNNVDLTEIKFGVRGPDNDAAVLAKPFSELKNADGEPLAALTTGWQDYEISFATTYEDTDTYVGTDSKIIGTGSAALQGIHIFAETDAEGTLDIAYVQYVGSSTFYLNNFIGADTVEAAAKTVDSGCWWAGSAQGSIVKRAPKITSGGELTVVKEEAVGKYKYAVIEATGDVSNLSVATTTDGTTWGENAAYDGYSVNLTGAEKGFKFTYSGSDANGVSINRIYLTNNIVQAPATAVPIIDASTAQLLDDFSVAQSGINDNYDEMSTAPEAGLAGMDYRISYSNGDKLEIKDGNLVLDVSELGDGFINFKFKSKSAAKGKFVVLKVKGEGGADLSGLRFSLGNPEDAYGSVVWMNDMKAAFGLAAQGMVDSNPYKTSDGWYYLVVDIEESGFGVSADGYGGMDMYYSGSGKLLIDEIFFADEVEKTVLKEFVVQNEAGDGAFSLDFTASDEGYQYACEVKGLDNLDTNYSLLALDIEIAEGTDLSGVRFAFADGTRWGGENAEGTLLLEDGTPLASAGFVAGEAKTVYIDLAKSDITMSNFHIHTNGTGTGSFKINSAKLMNYMAAPAVTQAYATQMANLPIYLDSIDPEVSITNAATANVGDEITVTYTATDNATATEDLTVEITVTKDGSPVELVGNKFTAEEGVYTVTVKVVDQNGNEATDTLQITVTAEKNGVKPGLSGGAIAGIVVGSVAGVALIAGLTVFLIKRKKK